MELNGHEGGNAGHSQAKPTAPSGGRTTPAEGVEGRRQAKGNAGPQNTSRAQDRQGVPSAWDRIRQAAKTDKGRRFTTLLHHVYNIETLREAYFGLKRDAAPGVDGETWQTYGDHLEANLKDLSERLQRGAYRAKPVRRVYIPKPGAACNDVDHAGESPAAAVARFGCVAMPDAVGGRPRW